MDWLNKILLRIASEVHKSRIDELEKRIAEMEKKHGVFNKTISDNERKIEKLEERMYQSDMTRCKFEGALSVVIDIAKGKQIKAINGGQENGQTIT